MCCYGCSNLVIILVQITLSNSGPMRNYTNGYHPAGGADPRYLNYGAGVVVPNLVNPRIPDPGISLEPKHHLEKYIGVRAGFDEYDYTGTEDVYNESFYGERSVSPVSPANLERPDIISPTNAQFIIENRQFDYDGSGYSDITVSRSTHNGKIHCRQGTRGYRSGDIFTLDGDPCVKCMCTRFGPQCNKTACGNLPENCFELLKTPNQCCPVCVNMGCFFRNTTLAVGEILQLTSCDQCQCKEDGRVYCSVADCTPPPCVDAVLPEGQCCPICPNGPNCLTDGEVIIPAQNEWIQMPDEACVLCRCWHRAGSQQLWMGNRKAQCMRDPNCRS